MVFGSGNGAGEYHTKVQEEGPGTQGTQGTVGSLK